MGQMEEITVEVTAANDNDRVITDWCARSIASLYDSGDDSISYTFVSTGAIPEADEWGEYELFISLFDSSYAQCQNIQDEEDSMAKAMDRYIRENAGRGRVEGWDSITF